MARRKQQHLGEVIRAAGGTSTVNTEVTALVARGIVLLRAERDRARLAERGTLVQQNPYVSDAGKCQRALAYKLMAIPESDPMTLDSLINIMTGEALEEWFATVLAAAIGGTVRQQRVDLKRAGSDIPVTGKKDFFIDHPEYGTIEVKSINSRAMGFMLRSGDEGKADHRRQLNLYLYANGEAQGWLVYIVKDAVKGEPPIHAFRVACDVDLAENDVLELTRTAERVRADMIPSRPEGTTRTTYPCSYCNFKSFCWREEN